MKIYPFSNKLLLEDTKLLKQKREKHCYDQEAASCVIRSSVSPPESVVVPWLVEVVDKLMVALLILQTSTHRVTSLALSARPPPRPAGWDNNQKL